MRAQLGIAGVGLIAGLLTACQQATRWDETRSSIQFVKPASPERDEKKGEPILAELLPQEIFLDAEPIGPLEEPIYPAHVSDGRAWMTTVGVTLSISPQGRVTAVETSVLALTIPGPFLAEFRAAVERAVRTWRFNPAEIRHVKPEQKGSGPVFWVVTRSEPVPTRLEVAFTFTGAGGVLHDPKRPK